MIVKVSIDEAKDRWSIGSFIENTLGEEVFDVILSYGWIAGGSLRSVIANEKARDIDVFCKNEHNLANLLITLKDKYKAIVMKDDSRVVDLSFGKDKPKVQLVKMFFDDPAECIDSFDITVSMFAMDRDHFYMGPYSLWDLSRKRIAIHKITFPMSTMRRLLKYAARGYWACDGALREMALSLQDKSLNQEIFYVD